jgi:predicted ArsR family transcriptional regulator
MDIFDERILSVLKDGKPRFLAQLLDEVGFSHNTLKLHLKTLLNEGFLVREKIASEGLGRPKFVYTVSPKLKKQVSAILSDLRQSWCTCLLAVSSTCAGSRRADTAKKPEPTATRGIAHRYPKSTSKNHF